MKKKIYLVAILTALIMQSMGAWSNTLGISQVNLYRKYAPKLDGNAKPTKAPANFSIPLTVYLDKDNHQLKVTSISDGDFTYYIYDEYGNVVTQDVINCSSNTIIYIDLWLCQSGVFSIVFTNDGNTYEGEFEIEY